MKKKINIEKKLDFSKMISEITAISLEHDLKFVDEENITGNLIVSGKYKSTIAAQIEDVFEYKIPVEISLTDRMDREGSKVDITDFSYEIYEENFLNCKIELLVDGIEIIDDRECDGDPIDTKELEVPVIDKKLESSTQEKSRNDNLDNNSFEEDLDNIEVSSSNCENIDDNSFFNIDSSKETYGTFIVYIVRQNETINSILEKYDTSLEEIEKYNDIKDLSIGTKLIIPLLKSED